MKCYTCKKEIKGTYVYRKEWDSYWHLKCYHHDKRVQVTLPISVVKKFRSEILSSDRDIKDHEKEFIYATDGIL